MSNTDSVFGIKNMTDNATYEEPDLLSTGIEYVWVNGTLVFEDGQTTGVYPGLIVNRSGFTP